MNFSENQNMQCNKKCNIASSRTPRVWIQYLESIFEDAKLSSTQKSNSVAKQGHLYWTNEQKLR